MTTQAKQATKSSIGDGASLNTAALIRRVRQNAVYVALLILILIFSIVSG